jgi:hypothetical protein
MITYTYGSSLNSFIEAKNQRTIAPNRNSGGLSSTQERASVDTRIEYILQYQRSLYRCPATSGENFLNGPYAMSDIESIPSSGDLSGFDIPLTTATPAQAL